jgi:hypothetical protein
MKQTTKILVLLLLLALCLPMMGCTQLLEHQLFSRFYNTDKSQAKAMLESLVAAMESGDTDAVKSLFSKQVQETVPNFGDSISALLRFYQGEMQSYICHGPGSSTSKEGHIYKKELVCSFDVTTTVGVYRIALLFCNVDTAFPEKVGLASVYIIRAEDSDPDRAYWGIDNENDIWNPGIHIE